MISLIYSVAGTIPDKVEAFAFTVSQPGKSAKSNLYALLLQV